MTDELKDSLRWYDEGSRMVPFEYYPARFDYTNNEVLLHWHTGTEITFVSEGSANYFIDGRKITSQAGDIFFIPSNTLHSVTEIDQVSETLVFHLNFIGLETSDYASINYLEPLQMGSIKSNYQISRDSPNYQKLAEVVQSLFASLHKKEPFFELKIKSDLLSFLYEIFSSELATFETKPLGRDRENQKTKELLSYIDENFDKKLQIQDLANFTNYSKSHFMAFFRKNFGMSCIEYIHSIRIKKAEEYLKYTDDTITEIAMKVGFTNLSSFNRLFKAKRGLSPRQYRNSLNETQ